MKTSKVMLPSLLCAIALAACSSAPTTTSNTPAAAPATAQAAAKVAPSTAPATPVAAQKAPSAPLPPYLDPSNPLSSKRSVYFDFDNFAVKPDFASTVEMHGKYLASNPTLAIRVEGNADERGSAEYNLALGQKRADAVARALKVFGVKDSQMEVISLGREKPKATGHDEAAWAENRRVDLAYPRK